MYTFQVDGRNAIRIEKKLNPFGRAVYHADMISIDVTKEWTMEGSVSLENPAALQVVINLLDINPHRDEAASVVNTLLYWFAELQGIDVRKAA